MLTNICDCTYCYNKNCTFACHDSSVQRGTAEGSSAVPYLVGIAILLGLTAPFIAMLLFGE